jgi:5-methylcytosine-specific restriction protein A
MPATHENDWSDDELQAAVDAYLEMLRCEKKGHPYNKAEINRSLRTAGGGIEGRTKGSVEYRMQNISAVLQSEDLDWVKGYKPAANVGETVRARIWKMLQKRGVNTRR